jgi:ubiquinone/menaquinone biosynthesis C-methylase UbiE
VRPPYSAPLLDRAQEALELAADARVLDLGAGTGRLTRELAQRFAAVTAVEPDDEMRALVDAGTVIAGSAESIPLEDGSVDGVFVGEAFHWFEARRAIAEIARVLVPPPAPRSSTRNARGFSTGCGRCSRAPTGCRSGTG